MEKYVDQFNRSTGFSIINKRKILKFLKEEKIFSQRDVVEKLNYHPATVSNFINLLKKYKLVKDIGVKDSTPKGGKKQRLLSLNSNLIYNIGIELRGDSAVIAVSDILESKFNIKVFSAGFTEKGEQYLKKFISDKLKKIIAEHKNKILVGVHILMPGIINFENNVIIYSKELKLKNSKIVNDLADMIDCSIGIDNNVNGLAYYIYQTFSKKNFIIFYFQNWGEKGIGASIFIDGKIYRGSKFNAGEIGDLFRDPFLSAVKDKFNSEKSIYAGKKLGNFIAQISNFLAFDGIFFYCDEDISATKFYISMLDKIKSELLHFNKDIQLKYLNHDMYMIAKAASVMANEIFLMNLLDMK